MAPRHLTTAELAAGLELIGESPRDAGVLHLIVCRPRTGQRELLEEAELDVAAGLVGDNWRARGSSRTPDGSAHPGMQINIMNSRVVDLLATSRERWALAGDQFFVDLDLSTANVPPGTRLSFGTAVLEVTSEPHTGCGKFVERFGVDAMKFVNSPSGRSLQLRGVNARVVQAGRVKAGTIVQKLER
jgi:hypothetical protein